MVSPKRPPVFPAVAREQQLLAFLRRPSLRGPNSQTRKGVGSPPTPKLCLKSKAGIRRRDGLFSGIPQRVRS